MPLLDHFHPPLHGPRRWEGFHHGWANSIAHQLNQDVLPPDYFAEPEISIGPEMEIDVASLTTMPRDHGSGILTKTWTPPKPRIRTAVNFSRLESCEVRVYHDIGGAELCAAIELVSPANKDRAESRQTFAAKCAGYVRNAIGLIIIDVVTARSANLHKELFAAMSVKGRRSTWESPTGLYAVAYRPVTVRKAPRVEAWPEVLKLARKLPIMPLWLSLNLCVPVRLEDSYLAACKSLRISA